MIKKIFNKTLRKIRLSLQPSKIDTVFKSEISTKNTNHINNQSKFKIKLITAFDKKFSEIGNLTSQSIARYANHYNFNYQIYDMPETGRAYSWNKISIILDEIKKKKNDFIMWVDADAFFSFLEKNISNELDNKFELFLVNHYCTIHKGSRYLNTKLAIKRINCGVMVFKVSDHNFEFLNKVWNNEKFINHPWWEQASIMDIIGYRAELNGDLNDQKGDNFYVEKIKYLSNDWNSIPSVNFDISLENHDPIIIHMAGMNQSQRIEFLDKYKKKKRILLSSD